MELDNRRKKKRHKFSINRSQMYNLFHFHHYIERIYTVLFSKTFKTQDTRQTQFDENENDPKKNDDEKKTKKIETKNASI